MAITTTRALITNWHKAIANCDTDAFGAAEAFDQGALRQRR
jgi:hypothetical protein